MALKVGDVYVAVTASIGEFTKSMAQVAKTTEDAAKKVKEAAKGVADVGMLFAAGIGGAVAAAAKTNAQMKAQLDKLQALFLTLAGDIGDAFAPVVERLVEAVSKVVAWFQSLSPELKGRLADFALLAAEIGLAALAVSKLAGLVEGMAKAFGVAARIIGAVSLPVVAVVAAVAALIAISALLWRAWKQNWGDIQGKTKSVLTWVSEKFQALATVFSTVTKVLVTRWASTMRFLTEKAKKFFEFIGADTLAGAMDFGTDLINWSEQLFTPEGLRDLFSDAQDVGGSIAEGIAFGLSETGGAVKEAVQDMLKASGLGGLFEGGGKATIRLTPEQREREAFDADMNRIAAQGPTAGGQARGFDPLARFAPGFEKLFSSWATTLRDAGASLAAQMRSGVASLGQAFLAGSGLFGRTVQAFMQGGPVMAVVTLLTASKQFQEAMGMLDGLFQNLADNLGRVFVAVAPLIGAVSTILLPVFDMLGDVAEMLGAVLAPLIPPLVAVGTLMEGLAPLLAMLASAVLFIMNPLNALVGPILRALFEVLKVVGGVVLEVAIAIGNVWNGILDAVRGVLQGISDALKFLGIGSFQGLINQLGGFRAPVEDMTEALAELNGLTWAQAEAKAAETAATLKTTKALNEATESLTNVPSWWKIASARFGAADPMGGTLAPAAGGGGAAVPGGPGVAPATGPAVVVEHMEVVGVNPDEAGSAMARHLERLGRRVGGNPVERGAFVVP